MKTIIDRPQTIIEAREEVRENAGNLFFEIGRSLRLFTLIEKIPFLELKPWVKERLNK